MPLHKFLGKILTPFQDGTRFAGTDYFQVFKTSVGFQIIPDAFHQRIFRPHDDHVHTFLCNEIRNS